ncbi:uncharacterized protein PG998_006455 [Apiospora kogelbergensis]|uniref:uncharacterized protein n=1 Tax=Apiospora kogelbergensis TaxID=1337665 RepID=UPI003130D1CD
MYKTAPYMTRKMLECTLAPLLHWLYICSLLICLTKAPALGLSAFVRQFPFAASYWWAAALVDKVQLLSDLYCWATLGTEAWETRNTDGDQEGDPLLLVEEVVREGRDA